MGVTESFNPHIEDMLAQSLHSNYGFIFIGVDHGDMHGEDTKAMIRVANMTTDEVVASIQALMESLLETMHKITQEQDSQDNINLN